MLIEDELAFMLDVDIFERVELMNLVDFKCVFWSFEWYRFSFNLDLCHEFVEKASITITLGFLAYSKLLIWNS